MVIAGVQVKLPAIGDVGAVECGRTINFTRKQASTVAKYKN